MLDEMQHLRNQPALYQLLEYYVGGNETDREVWLDRLMHVNGIDARTLVEMHGQLLAFGFLEQNTGVVMALLRGACPQCYRSTPVGRRAFDASRSAVDEESSLAA